MKNWFLSLKQKWLVITQAATWLMSLVSPFLFAPPTGLIKESGSGLGYYFAHFVICVLLGLIYVIAHKGPIGPRLWAWWAISAGSLVFSGSAWFYYVAKSSEWTVPYADGLVIRGEKYTDRARDLHKTTDDAELIKRAAGDVRAIWSDTEVINQRWLRLVLAYTLTASSAALCVMALLQTVALSFTPAKKPVHPASSNPDS